MGKLTVPASPSLYHTYYKDLKGVDWSAPATEVSRGRASNIKNMIPKDGEYVPIKRRGWRVVTTLDSNAVTSFHDSYNKIDYICTANKVYKYASGTFSVIGNGSFKHIIPFNEKIYLVGSSGLYEIDADHNGISVTNPFVPLIVIRREQDGTGGEAYYSVNALTTTRQISFWGNNTSKDYYLFPDQSNHLCQITKVEALNSSTGQWETVTYTAITGSTYTAYNSSGVATSYTNHIGFTLAAYHPSDINHGGLNQDSVRVTFDELDMTVATGTTRYGYKRVLGDKILNSDIMTVYGAVNLDRAFAVVDQNSIYYTEASDITFWADDNYLVAGNFSPIMGLHRKENYLVAITGDSSNHAVFMIKSNTAVVTTTTEASDGSMTTSSEEQQFFSVRPATSGTGAIATKSFATLIDEPLFLGTTGIFAVTTNALTTETVVMNRSTYVNPKLVAESNLQNAVATVWKDYYILCVNSHCYILDSNVITKDKAGNRVYECYYWTNVPATSFLAYGNELWFGTNTGKWCKFNTDFDDDEAYIDDGTFTESDGELVYTEDTGDPVEAVYETVLDDDGYPQYFKNLNKKGCVVTLLPQNSSVEVYFSKNGDTPVKFAKASVDTGELEIDTYTLKKVKKYKRLKFIFKNSKAEPFGLIKFTKTWSLGNFAK